MACINDGAIVLQNGAVINFEGIFPVKILYPYVLMDNSTVYNLIYNKFIVDTDGKYVDNIIDIFYSYINGLYRKQCMAIFIKFKNGTLKCLTHGSSIISDHHFYTGIRNINSVNALHNGTLISKIIIYMCDDELIVENYSKHTIVDDNCCHIVTNISDHLLEISLLKNNNIKVYSFDLTTNLFVLKKEINVGFNVHKIVRQYLIDTNGRLYFVAVPNYQQVTITLIETEYKICDMMPIDYSLNKFLLLSCDGKIIRYNSVSNKMIALNLSGFFSLNYGSAKSAKNIFIQS
jgi:hypothetical protein